MHPTSSSSVPRLVVAVILALVAMVLHPAAAGAQAETGTPVPPKPASNHWDFVVSASSVTLTEGGTATFTVALNAAPGVTVFVNVGSNDTSVVTTSPPSLNFNSTNWSTGKTVTVTPVNDSVVGDRTTSIRILGVNSGFSGVEASVGVTVEDDDAALTLPADPVSLTEGGGSQTFSVALAAAPTGTVTVDVASNDTNAATVSPSSLTFTTSDWSTGKDVTVTPVHDDDATDETVTVTLSAENGDYDGVTGTVTVNVDDDETQGLVLSPSSLSMNEGDKAPFTVVLASKPTAPVTVTVTSSDTAAAAVDNTSLNFSTTNWNNAQSVEVTALQDAGAEDESVAVTIAATGGDYEGVTNSVSVVVDDDETPALVVSASTLNLTEGTTDSFTVDLAVPSEVAVTVTPSSSDPGAVAVSGAVLFTPGLDDPQSIMVAPVQDDDPTDETATVTLTASGGVYEGVTTTVSVNVEDDETPGLDLSPNPLTVTEGETGTFTVALATAPAGTVTVAVASGDMSVASVSPLALDFTLTNWSTPQTVTVTTVDYPFVGDRSVNVTLTAIGGGYDSLVDTVAVTVDDDDAQLTLTPASVSLTERHETNGTGTFTVALAAVPTGDVTVAVTSADPGAVTVSPSTDLTFNTTNWAAAQTVTVTAVNDVDASDESVSVNLTASGGDYDNVAGSVTVTVTDNDAPGLNLSDTTVALSEGAASGSFVVSLDTEPSAEVTVTVTSADPDAVAVATTTQSLTFGTGNWNIPQSVIVSPAVDADAANESVVVTLAASGGDYGEVTGSVTVTVDDDESVGLDVSATTVAVTEGGATGSFTVKLTSQPTANVVVAVASADPGAVTVSADSLPLQFNAQNWNATQTVTVTPVEDADAGNESVTVNLTAAGGDYVGQTGSVTVTVDDDETAALTVTGSPVALTEGHATNGTGTFTVALATPPTVEVTVTVSSADTGAATVNPASLRFAIGESAAQTVTVTAVNDDNATDESVSVALSASGGEYADVSSSATVTVDDDESVGYDLSAGTVAITEGGSAGTFTVRLTSEPTADVTVAVTSADAGAVTVSADTLPLTFTTSNWNATQTVTVTAVDDADAGNESVRVNLAATSTGDYSGLAGSVTVTIDDDETAAVNASVSSVALTEGHATDARASFTVALATPPTVDVILTVAGSDAGAVTLSASSLTFTARETATKTVFVTAVNDDDAADESVTVTLSASGGEYDDVGSSVTVTVDDDESVGYDLSATTVELTEGGAVGTFTVKLTSEPTADLTVAVTSADTGAVAVSAATLPLRFTAANWDTAQTVTLTAVADADAGNETVSVSLAATSTGDYSGLTGAVSVTVDDDETAAVTVAPATVSVDEGDATGSTFTVALATPPTVEVTVALAISDVGAVALNPTSLTFDEGNNAAQTVTVTAVDDADAANESVTITATATGGEYANVANSVAVTVDDDETASVTPSKTSMALAEGATDSFTVVLATPPTVNVTVAVSSADTGAVTVDKPSLTFNADNYNQPQTVMVTSVQDNDATNESVSVSLSASGGEYADVGANVTVTVDDDEEVGLTLSLTPPASLSLTEGGDDGTFTVVLTSAPTAEVTISVTSSDSTTATAAPATLTFTAANYNTAQTVTVSSVEDAVVGARTATITLDASGGDYGDESATVAVSVADNDAALTLSATSLTVGEADSDGGTFTVALAAAPSDTVTVTVANSNTTVATVRPESLTFTTDDWTTAQEVTVEPIDNATLGNGAATVSFTAAGPDYNGVTASVNVTVTDDDGRFILSDDSFALTEGGDGETLDVRLSAEPTSDVIVTFTSADSGAVTVTPSTLTFTTGDWATAQGVTLTAAQDADAADESTTVALSASGGGYHDATASVTVTVTDDDQVAMTVSAQSLSLSEGGVAGSFTVTLLTAPTANVTVSVSADDPDAVTVNPAQLTFTPANYSTGQRVTVAAEHDLDAVDESLSLSITASGADYGNVSASLSVTITDDEEAAFTLAPATLSLTEGGAVGSFTVALATLPTQPVTVSVTSGDTAAVTVSPASLSFTAANYTTPQTVTVTAVQDPDAANEEITVALAGSGGEYGTVTGSATVSVTDDDTPGLTATPATVTVTEGGDPGSFTVVLITEPISPVTVSVASADAGAATVAPAVMVFTADNWSTARPVTVTPVDDADLANESVTVSLTASGGLYGSVTGAVSVTVNDDDTVLVVSASEVSIVESGTGSFDVTLPAAPSANVTVAVSSADTGAVTAAPASLSFNATNFSQAQTVTLTGVADDDSNNETVSISLTATGGQYEGETATVSARVTDDDTAAIGVSASSLSLAEGATGTFNVVLTTQPTANVTVAVSSDTAATATVTPTELTFTAANYNTAQTVTVTAVQNTDAGNSATIDLSASSDDTSYADLEAEVSVSVADDDASLTLSATSLSATEGGAAATFTVALAAPPSGNVTVAIAGSDPDAVSVSPPTVLFTPGNHDTARTVTLIPQSDDNADNEAVTITLTASGGGYDGQTGEVAMTVTDDDTAGFTLSADELSVTEEASTTFTVALATPPSTDVTVTITSPNPDVATVNGESSVVLAFYADSYSVAQTVTVSGLPDKDMENLVNESVALGLTASGGGYGSATGSVNVTVVDDDAQIRVSTTRLAVTEGGDAVTFGVTLKSKPTGDVTVTVTSSNTSAATASPETLTFTAADYTEEQTVTVEAPEDADTANTTVTLTLTPTDGGYGAFNTTVSVAVTDNDTPVIIGGGGGGFFPPAAGPSGSAACDDPTLSEPNFSDVELANVHYPGIRCVFHYGISRGTGDGTTFDPWSTVTRSQMALFAVRLAEVTGVVLTEGSADDFEDLDGVFDEARQAIGTLVASGLLRGRTSTAFDPYSPMTRSQMSIVMARLLQTQAAYVVGDTSGFGDVDGVVPDEHQRSITLLFQQGIVQGLAGGNNFGPYQPVTRAQMATIMGRILNTELPPIITLG